MLIRFLIKILKNEENKDDCGSSPNYKKKYYNTYQLVPLVVLFLSFDQMFNSERTLLAKKH